MPLPHFLIIGAMKAGTTTLYDDLGQHPGVCMSSQKEPEGLLHIDAPGGLERYERSFRAAQPGQRIGEASTAYAKRPEHEGVAKAAARLLGPDLKIIYIMRDPIKRIVSQYQHEVGLGLEARPFDIAVREDPRYVAFSRYDYQLEPWRAELDSSHILCLRFEDYVQDRAGTLAQVAEFLGLDEAGLPTAFGGARNASAQKPVAKGAWRGLMRSGLYLDHIKPLLNSQTRDRLKQWLLPVAKNTPVILDDDTVQWLQASLTEADHGAYRDARLSSC